MDDMMNLIWRFPHKVLHPLQRPWKTFGMERQDFVRLFIEMYKYQTNPKIPPKLMRLFPTPSFQGVIGDGEDILVRVHSECFTGDIFGSARCDCGNQLALAMQKIEAAGKGVLLYLRGHEGRGIGLSNKFRSYNLQNDGLDTVEANVELGLPVDSREYGIGAQILRDLGVRSMKLMTNNPAKLVGLKGYGVTVSGRIPLVTLVTKENRRYMETKHVKMGHMYNSDGECAGN